MTDKSLHVKVQFLGNEDLLSQDDRCALLMAFERHARETTGKDIRVYADRMGDDSKLRTLMTTEERAKL